MAPPSWRGIFSATDMQDIPEGGGALLVVYIPPFFLKNGECNIVGYVNVWCSTSYPREKLARTGKAGGQHILHGHQPHRLLPRCTWPLWI